MTRAKNPWTPDTENAAKMNRIPDTAPLSDANAYKQDLARMRAQVDVPKESLDSVTTLAGSRPGVPSLVLDALARRASRLKKKEAGSVEADQGSRGRDTPSAREGPRGPPGRGAHEDELHE